MKINILNMIISPLIAMLKRSLPTTVDPDLNYKGKYKLKADIVNIN